jgi:hypothetical protein
MPLRAGAGAQPVAAGQLPLLPLLPLLLLGTLSAALHHLRRGAA